MILAICLIKFSDSEVKMTSKPEAKKIEGLDLALTPPENRSKYLSFFPNLKAIILEKPISSSVIESKKIIDISKEAGFDAVKFQKRNIEIVYSKEQLETPRESPWGKTTRQQKEGLEFGTKEYDDINDYCKKKGIGWFASAWDLDSLMFLDKYKLKYNKIASAMIIDHNFLTEVAKEKNILLYLLECQQRKI